MIESLPSDIQHFIQAQIMAGKYSSEADVVAQAVGLLREREDNYQRLKSEIRKRFAAVDSGDYIELNGDEELASFFHEIKREVDEELARERNSRE